MNRCCELGDGVGFRYPGWCEFLYEEERVVTVVVEVVVVVVPRVV